MKTPSNIVVGNINDYSSRASVSWILDGARFHVWFDTKTMEIDRDRVIYKNPLPEVAYNSPEHFKTRHLDMDTPSNAALVKHIFEVIKDGALIEAAIAQQKRADAEADAKRQQVARDNRRESFTKLLAEMHEHDHDELINALSAQLSLDDIDALQGRLP